MNTKGTSVKTTPDFVKTHFKDRYYEWLDSLPDVSKRIVGQPIYATSWFDLYDSVVVPTEKVGEMFYSSAEEAAYELGKFSSEAALNGVYKIFIKISSPNFVLSRATNVFNTYYDKAEIQIVESKDNYAVMRISGFKREEELVIQRIIGWIEKTIELTTKSAEKPIVKKVYVDDYIVVDVAVKW